MKTENTTGEYEVLYGTHEDSNDFDGGRKFDTLEEARAEFLNPQDEYYGDAEYLVLTGPDDLWEDRYNAKPKRDDGWRREIAMQAGMSGGCVAYNDAMGW